ncbi:MAG: HEAT repeat domain-containing protein [Anaerolineae bacterium]
MSGKDLRSQLEGLFSDIVPEPEAEEDKSLLEQAVFGPAEAEIAEAEIVKGEPMAAEAPPLTPTKPEGVERERQEVPPTSVLAWGATLRAQCRRILNTLPGNITVTGTVAKFAKLSALKEAILKASRCSTYDTVVAFLLALALLAGLIVLVPSPLQIPQPTLVPDIYQKYRLFIAAGLIGLLLLLIGYLLSRRLRDWLARRRESRQAEIQPEALAMAYRHKLMAQLGQLRVMDVARPFELETSYVPLRVREPPRLYSEGNGATPRPLSSLPLMGQTEGGGETMSPQEALVRFRHLALLGEPGAGKTTLLRHLALQAAQGKLDELPDFPVFISLGHFAAAASQISLLDFVITEIDAFHKNSLSGSPALRSYLEERLEEGSVFLLLDALDEASVGPPQEAEATYRHVIGQINVLTARYPKIPVVVTSRRAGWKGLLAASFHTLEVLQLGEDDIQGFIEDWFGKGSKQAGELRSNILQNPQVRAMAANPLLLSLMALAFEQDGKLPEGRAGLYGRGVELLLEKWETDRVRKRVSGFTAEHQRGLQEEVALHFHLRRHLYFPRYELSGITASYLSAVGLPADWVPRALERLSAQYGLIGEQVLGWYSFPHLAWQEYFAAAAISKRGQLELVLEDVSDSWWEGTILFLAEMLEDATPLLEGILNQEDDVFCSNLLLAGRCLAGKPRIKRASLRENIIERLQGLVKGEVHPSSLILRQQAIGVLAEIGDPSIAACFMSLVTAKEIDQTVRRLVTTALTSLGDESTVTNLMALLSDQGIDVALRINVAAALSSLPPSSLSPVEGTEWGVVPQFLALLPDEEVDYRVRMGVAEALGALGTSPEQGRRGSRSDESVIPQLVRLLPNEKIDYRVRVRVAEVLGALGACPEPCPERGRRGSRRDGSIASQLLRLLRDEKVDYNVRMSVAETLGSLGDKSISRRLLAILPKKKIDPDVRASIAAALGSLGDESVLPQLLRLLANEKIDPSIRWRIVDSLRELGAMDDEATAPELLALLSNEKVDSSVRVIVAETMGEKTVTPRLPTPIPVGREAAEALRSLGDRSKVPQLLALLPDRELERSMRLKIVEALGALGDDRVTAESLATLLDDEEIGSDVYQALFLVSQRIRARVFSSDGGRYEIR